MKKNFYELGQNAIVYGLGTVAQPLVGFLLLPVYTSRLNPDEYGRLALITTLNTLLGVLLGMGISTSVFKHFFKEKTVKGRQLIISSAFFWLIGLGVVTIIFLFPLSTTIAKVMLESVIYTEHIKMMTVTLALMQIQIIPYGVLRAEKKPQQYIFLTLSNFVLNVGLNIYFVVYVGAGILGILWAGLLSSFTFVLAGIYLCRHMIRLIFSWSAVKSMLRYGIPLVPAAISFYILNQSDRWFLQHFTTMQEVGIYSLGYKIGSIINFILIQPVQLIWMPIVYEKEHQPDATAFYQRMLTYMLLIGCWIGIGLSSFTKELLLFASPEYHTAYAVIPWIVFAYVINGAYIIVVIGIFLKDKTSYAALITGIAGISNILFNFLLIPTFGSLGAAQSTLLSFMVMFWVAWLVNHYVYPLQYEWGRIMKILLVSLFLLFTSFYVVANMFLSLVLKVSILLAYWEILYLVKFYNKEEITWAKSVVRIASSKLIIK
jgi:O-antigen/teichoic acid export membrane protein